MEEMIDPDRIDWNAVWTARKRKSREGLRGRDCGHEWERKEEAERYAREADLGYQKRIKEEMALLPINASSTVLDIGSGPGPLTIPVARRARHVTAVEPAAGMVAVLADRVKEAGLSNVDWVQKRWEETDPVQDLHAPYDLVIASFSLTMADIGEAIRKMDMVSCGSVYLFDFIDGPLWERMASGIWEELHGEPFIRGPKADILWNVLYQMGIYANVLMRPLQKTYRFSSLDEAAGFFGRRFRVADSTQELVLRRYLAEINMAEDTSFLYERDSIYATLWWTSDH